MARFEPYKGNVKCECVCMLGRLAPYNIINRYHKLHKLLIQCCLYCFSFDMGVMLTNAFQIWGKI